MPVFKPIEQLAVSQTLASFQDNLLARAESFFDALFL
jgi:hypothetical protein